MSIEIILQQIVEKALDERFAQFKAELLSELKAEPDRLLTTEQAALLSGKKGSSICRWCRGFTSKGVFMKLKSQRAPDGGYRILESDLRAFFTASTAVIQPQVNRPNGNEGWSFTNR